ncbi:MAG: hypothetical protein AAFV62_03790, partial [Pseudomonadota bacterium]
MDALHPGRGQLGQQMAEPEGGNAVPSRAERGETKSMSSDKQKALESALAQIERNFGKGSIMKLGSDSAMMDIEAVSTGSLGLDIAL